MNEELTVGSCLLLRINPTIARELRSEIFKKMQNKLRSISYSDGCAETEEPNVHQPLGTMHTATNKCTESLPLSPTVVENSFAPTQSSIDSPTDEPSVDS